MENKQKSFSYKIIDGIDKIVDEGASDYIAIRKMSWNINGKETEPKLNIRRYTHDEKKGLEFSKGFSFITEEGPHNMVSSLLELGYGHTRDILDSIKTREDFIPSLNFILNDEELDINIPENIFKPELDLVKF